MSICKPQKQPLNIIFIHPDPCKRFHTPTINNNQLCSS